MSPPARQSPIARLVRIGERIVDQAIETGVCPLLSCRGEGGQHVATCLIGEALRFDPVIRRRLEREDEQERGGRR